MCEVCIFNRHHLLAGYVKQSMRADVFARFVQRVERLGYSWRAQTFLPLVKTYNPYTPTV